jgi:Lar family restriction alleviation protein
VATAERGVRRTGRANLIKEKFNFYLYHPKLFLQRKEFYLMNKNNDFTQTMKLVLASCPNPDFGQTEAPASRQEVPVGSYRQASQIARAYIKEYDLGGGNWSGGQILDENGAEVADVSYNGRVWVGEDCVFKPQISDMPIIQPDSAGPMPEMKPCPFCGETNLEQAQISGENEISCLTCGISIHFDVDLSKEEIFVRWNQRRNYSNAQPRESLNIGDQAIYIGHRHPFLYNRKVQVVAVYKGYFVDPAQSVVIRDRQALDRAGGIEPAEDMVEVQPVSNGRLLLGGSDTWLSELSPLLPEENSR